MTDTSRSGTSTETPTSDLPPEVEAWIGERRYEEEGEFPVERGYFWTAAASVENGNPLYWDDDAGEAITGGPVAPPTMTSAWFRPHWWHPGQVKQKLPLQIHFDLKERLELPEAIMSDNTLILYEPIRPGDMITAVQVLKSVSGIKKTRVGMGRFWVIDVEYSNQKGELCAVESFTGFGYRRFEDA
jgi:hypothetical protein